MATAVIVDAVRTPMAAGATATSRAGTPPTWPPSRSRPSSSGTTSTRRSSTTSSWGRSCRSASRRSTSARNAVLAAGLPRVGAGHDRRPPVRVVAAGDPLRRPGRDRRGLRRRDRRRDRVDDPGADGRVAGQGRVRHAVRDGMVERYGDAELPSRLQGSRPPGHLGRDHLRAVGPLPRAARRVRAAQPAVRRPGQRRGPLRQRDRARPQDPARPGDRRDDRQRRDGEHRRGHPGHVARGAGQPQAGIQGRRTGHRGQLVADHRRLGRPADHDRGEGERPRAHPRARFVEFAVAGADPVRMLTAPIPATRKVLERAKLDLDQIDLVEINEAFAAGRAGVGEGRRRRPRPGERQRRRHRPGAPARRLRAPGWPPRCSTSSSAPAAVSVCRRCARAAAWPTPSSSNASAEAETPNSTH